MKYKIGDKVKVRRDLAMFKEINQVNITEGMKEFAGKIVTIKDTRVPMLSYIIEEDKNYCFWIDEMFEDIKTNEIEVRENSKEYLKGKIDAYIDILTKFKEIL